MTATALRYTSSREADNALRVARVAAAGRVRAERERADRERAALVAASRRYVDSHGQAFAVDPWDVDYCYVCGRCTDHLGEHTPAQIAAWKAGR
jgi:hypothetical protein